MSCRLESRLNDFGGEYKRGDIYHTDVKNINNPSLSDRGVGEEEKPLPTIEEHPRSKKWKKPTIEEIVAYCKERNNGLDGEKIFWYYEATGWKRGKAQIPIKDWRACVRTWESNQKHGYTDYINRRFGPNPNTFKNFEQRNTNYDELIRQISQ